MKAVNEGCACLKPDGRFARRPRRRLARCDGGRTAARTTELVIALPPSVAALPSAGRQAAARERRAARGSRSRPRRRGRRARRRAPAGRPDQARAVAALGAAAGCLHEEVDAAALCRRCVRPDAPLAAPPTTAPALSPTHDSFSSWSTAHLAPASRLSCARDPGADLLYEYINLEFDGVERDLLLQARDPSRLRLCLIVRLRPCPIGGLMTSACSRARAHALAPDCVWPSPPQAYEMRALVLAIDGVDEAAALKSKVGAPRKARASTLAPQGTRLLGSHERCNERCDGRCNDRPDC